MQCNMQIIYAVHTNAVQYTNYLRSPHQCSTIYKLFMQSTPMQYNIQIIYAVHTNAVQFTNYLCSLRQCSAICKLSTWSALSQEYPLHLIYSHMKIANLFFSNDRVMVKH